MFFGIEMGTRHATPNTGEDSSAAKPCTQREVIRRTMQRRPTDVSRKNVVSIKIKYKLWTVCFD